MNAKNLTSGLFIALTLALGACGGGGADGGGTVNNTIPAPPAGELVTGTSTASSAAVAGNIVYGKYTDTLSPTKVTLTAAIVGNNGTLTFSPSGIVLATTTNSYGSVNWNPAQVNSGAAMYADGNLLTICSPGGAEGGYLSTNMVPVTNLSEVHGKTFTERDCNGASFASTTIKVNADGSVTFDGEDTLTVVQVQQYFSNVGLTVDGNNFKARLFKYSPAGGPAQYFFVDAFVDGGVAGLDFYTTQ